MRRNFIVGSLAVLVFSLSLVAVSAKANFSGTWNLDLSKSEGLPPTIKGQVMTVTQTEGKLNIESKITTDQGDQSVSDTYTLDGKPADFTSKGPNGVEGKGKRTVKWSDDGNRLEVKEEITYDTPNGAVALEIARTWTLSADGKTLTIVMDISSVMGAQQIKRVFAKK